MLSSMLKQLASLPTFALSPRGTWQQLTAAASNSLEANPQQALHLKHLARAVCFFFSLAQRALSRIATSRVISGATRIADPRRSQRRATVSHWSLVFSTLYREATAL